MAHDCEPPQMAPLKLLNQLHPGCKLHAGYNSAPNDLLHLTALFFVGQGIPATDLAAHFKQR